MDEDRAWLFEQIRERLRYYGSMSSFGLRVVASRHAGVGIAEPVGETAPAEETLQRIREHLGECTRCKLHAGRRTIVFGAGNPNARLMFVGEGPGEEEDVQGLPFVGPAGQLLTRMIAAIGMSREEVYIANVVKCRPPGNREPEPDEVATCRPFLERQIKAVGPRVLCTLGRVAAQTLLSTEDSLRALRGRTFRLGDAILVPTYHPAYLLRYPDKKREAWEDLKAVRRLLDERG